MLCSDASPVAHLSFSDQSDLLSRTHHCFLFLSRVLLFKSLPPPLSSSSSCWWYSVVITCCCCWSYYFSMRICLSKFLNRKEAKSMQTFFLFFFSIEACGHMALPEHSVCLWPTFLFTIIIIIIVLFFLFFSSILIGHQFFWVNDIECYLSYANCCDLDFVLLFALILVDKQMCGGSWMDVWMRIINKWNIHQTQTDKLKVMDYNSETGSGFLSQI